MEGIRHTGTRSTVDLSAFRTLSGFSMNKLTFMALPAITYDILRVYTTMYIFSNSMQASRDGVDISDISPIPTNCGACHSPGMNVCLSSLRTISLIPISSCCLLFVMPSPRPLLRHPGNQSLQQHRLSRLRVMLDKCDGSRISHLEGLNIVNP